MIDSFWRHCWSIPVGFQMTVSWHCCVNSTGSGSHILTCGCSSLSGSFLHQRFLLGTGGSFGLSVLWWDYVSSADDVNLLLISSCVSLQLSWSLHVFLSHLITNRIRNKYCAAPISRPNLKVCFHVSNQTRVQYHTGTRPQQDVRHSGQFIRWTMKEWWD